MGKLLKIILRPEIFYISIFFIAFIIFYSTMLPGLGFWDTGEFQTVIYTFDVAHPTGYPTYLILGKIFTILFPFGSIAWRVNLLSVIFTSLGIYIFALALHKLTKNYLVTFASSLFLISNPYLWSVSTSADPHSLHFLFFSIIFFLTLQIFDNAKYRYLPYLALTLGLSLGNHLLSIFFIPPILTLLILKRKKFDSKRYLLSVFLFLLGLGIYLLIYYLGKIKPPLTTSYSTGTLSELYRHITGGDFKPFMHGWTKGNLKDTLNYFYSISQNFFGLPLLALSLLGIFLIFFFSPQVGLFLLLLFLGVSLFSLRYQNAFLERYFIIPYAVLTVSSTLIPYCLKKVAVNLKQKKLKTYLSLTSIFLAFALLMQGVSNFLQLYPQKDQGHNLGAENFADKTFASIAPNGVIFSWWSYSTPLWYEQRVESKRPDIKIVNANQSDWESMAQKYVRTNPVYFLDEIPIVSPDYRLIPEGNLFRYQKVN